MNYNFFTNCVSCPDHLVQDLSEMVDDAREIKLKTFKKKCNPFSLKLILEDLGYTKCSMPKIEKDWHVKYFTSKFAGNNCVFFVHSAIEYIFLDDSAATYLLS